MWGKSPATCLTNLILRERITKRSIYLGKVIHFPTLLKSKATTRAPSLLLQLNPDSLEVECLSTPPACPPSPHPPTSALIQKTSLAPILQYFILIQLSHPDTGDFQLSTVSLPFLSLPIPPASFPSSKAIMSCSNEDISYVSSILKTGALLMDDSLTSLE